jgi:hypothetical protein
LVLLVKEKKHNFIFLSQKVENVPPSNKVCYYSSNKNIFIPLFCNVVG